MEPKFQSSFIPKGPIATNSTASKVSRQSEHSLLGTIASLVFVITLLTGVGLFGYEWYLNHDIQSMGQSLSEARNTLEPDIIQSITELNDRINSTKLLLNKHLIVSPVFALLERDTLKTVRFTNFDLTTNENKFVFVVKGLARGYNALALQSQVFASETILEKPVFSDLDLDDKGNVSFTFKAEIDPSQLLYKNTIITPVDNSLQTQSTTTTSSSTSTSTKP